MSELILSLLLSDDDPEVELPVEPVSDGELVEPPIEEPELLPVEPVPDDEPALPDDEPPSEPLEPLEPVSDDPELPECFEELLEEPFGITSMFVSSEPEKLART